MEIRNYLDSTYLKTAEQAGISPEENKLVVEGFIQEAIEERMKLIMIRPEMVSVARNLISKANSKLLIGTVIDFPEGKSSIEIKLQEAAAAIDNGTDELDFVCNYEAFIAGDSDLVKEEIFRCTAFGLSNAKVVKWIIEVAALSDQQIIALTTLIKNTVILSFKEDSFSSVFIKSSTGFYKTKNNLPNGATLPTILLMLKNASPLPVKAAGGIRSYDDALAMINLGVKRIGTSSAKEIIYKKTIQKGY